MTDPSRKRLNFDPTINLGHVLTFVGFLAAGFGAYSTLDKRLTIQEEKTSAAEARQREQQTAVKEALHEIRSDVKEVQRSVNDVNRALNQPRPRQ
jgi:protein subunit release factor B